MSDAQIFIHARLQSVQQYIVADARSLFCLVRIEVLDGEISASSLILISQALHIGQKVSRKQSLIIASLFEIVGQRESIDYYGCLIGRLYDLGNNQACKSDDGERDNEFRSFDRCSKEGVYARTADKQRAPCGGKETLH